MRLIVLLSVVVATASGCTRIELEYPDGFMHGCTTPDGGTNPPDLLTPAPKCAAAKGLAGDNLLCVDFKEVQMPSSLGGWSFSCTGTALWSTASGLLQVNSFGTFQDECTARLPPINLNDADKQKDRSLTLSLIQRIDLSDPEQKAQVFLNDASDPTRLMYFATGKKTPSRQVTTISLDKTDLPAMVNNSPQWVLKVSSTGMFGRQGWQIESIAIQGIP